MKNISRLARELPYLLRVVILILFFNGFFALIQTLLSPLAVNGFSFDIRSVNIFIALGLATKKKFGYVLGIISIASNIALHSLRLSELTFADGGILFYFLLALAIDMFQFYILIRKSTQTIYFSSEN